MRTPSLKKGEKGEHEIPKDRTHKRGGNQGTAEITEGDIIHPPQSVPIAGKSMDVR